MKAGGTIRREVLVTGAAVLVFALFLVLAAVRLVDVERELDISAGEDLVWAFGQAQQEMQLLGTAFDRGDTGQAELRFDLAASRFLVLGEGGMGRRVAELGLEQVVADAAAAVTALERHGTAPDIDATAALASHVRAFRSAANAVMVAERERLGAQRDAYRRALIEVLACMAGIFAVGLYLIVRLLKSLGRAATAEEQLRRETRFLNLLLESSGEGVVAFDRELRCTHWNGTIGKVFAKPAGAVIGGKLLEVFPFPDDHSVTQMLRRTLEGYDEYQGDHLVPGTDRYLEKASFPLRVDGEVVGGIIIVRDVTERNRAQRELARHHAQLEELVRERTAELHRTEEQLRSAIGTAPDGFAAFDADGRLIVANAKLRELFPARPELFEPGALLVPLLEAAGLDARTIAAAGEAGETPLTHELRHDDGSWSLLMLRRAPDGSTVIRFADVTVYQVAAESLRSALAREQRLRQLYRDFVSMVSHQFRTPLAIVDSGAQRLIRRRGEVTAEEIEARATRMRAAIKRLASLIEGTLDASRMDAGQIDFNPRHCDLARLVRDACERQAEISPEHRFRLELDGLPATLECDPLLVDQVVGNLIGNAAKYSPAGSEIVVRGSVDAEAVTLSVGDRGVGIPEDEMPRVFDRFFRARTANGFQGTGLGLHVAREIARMHGGDIAIASREGEGTTASLTLPLRQMLPVAAQ